MTTYFIRTALPLDESHRAVFAQHHSEATNGNQLSVMTNGAGTECLVKVNCSHTIESIMPVGFVSLEIITDIDVARALLHSAGWLAQS